jgi:hypothetical protein
MMDHGDTSELMANCKKIEPGGPCIMLVWISYSRPRAKIFDIGQEWDICAHDTNIAYWNHSHLACLDYSFKLDTCASIFI